MLDGDILVRFYERFSSAFRIYCFMFSFHTFFLEGHTLQLVKDTLDAPNGGNLKDQRSYKFYFMYLTRLGSPACSLLQLYFLILQSLEKLLSLKSQTYTSRNKESLLKLLCEEFFKKTTLFFVFFLVINN